MNRWSAGHRLVVAAALLKVVIGISSVALAVAVDPGRITPRNLLMLAHVGAFGTGAALLLGGSRQDRRAISLGIFFLLGASIYADRMLDPWADIRSPLLTGIRGIFALRVDAFSPFFFWLFVREFPSAAPFGPRAQVPRMAMTVSLVVGAWLFTLNLLNYFASLSSSLAWASSFLDAFARANNQGLYWPLVFGVILPAFPALAWKTWIAAPAERQRVSLLTASIVIASAPIAVWTFLTTMSPTALRLLPLSVAGWVLYPTMLSVPITTAYAVLVRQALHIRLIVRRAIQYALARYTIVIGTAIPFLLLVVSVYRHRDRSVAELLSGPDGLALSGLAAAGLLMLRGRRGMMDRIDRQFFREQYDSRRILGQLVERSQKAASGLDLAEILNAEIDRALHLESSSVLLLESGGTMLRDPTNRVRPVDVTSELVSQLRACAGALDFDFVRSTASFSQLPESDRYWVADAAVRLLLPIKDARDELIGMIALGEKKSEQPFSEEDVLLLKTVATAASVPLAHARGAPGADHQALVAAREELAVECAECRTVYAPTVRSCDRCGVTTRSAPVPLVLAGKFRFVERIGEGAMGVVYRGVDLGLGRSVAIKTLPRVAPDRAVRLRREARTIASVSHANLAPIFGAESWNGLPMLVFEYLPGGTLADRLQSGPLLPAAAVDLGIALSNAVATLHRAGLLHRDIKPSNIGFAADGTPKLLDFGFAHILGSSFGLPGDPAVRSDTESARKIGLSEHEALLASVEGHLQGTLPYLSPEALRGAAAQPSFDLWSICVVLYEAVAGHNPVMADSVQHTLLRIQRCEIPDVRESAPAVGPELAAFFRDTLSADPADRPKSAHALAERLRRLRAAPAVAAKEVMAS